MQYVDFKEIEFKRIESNRGIKMAYSIEVKDKDRLIEAERDVLRNTNRDVLAAIVITEYSKLGILSFKCDTTMAMAIMYAVNKQTLEELVFNIKRISGVKNLDKKLPSLMISPNKEDSLRFLASGVVNWLDSMNQCARDVFLPVAKKSIDEERIEFSRIQNTFAEIRQAFKSFESAYMVLSNSKVFTSNPKFYAFLTTAMNNTKFHDTVDSSFIEKAIVKCDSLLAEDYLKPTMIQIEYIKAYFVAVMKYKKTSQARDSQSALETLFSPAETNLESQENKPLSLAERLRAKKLGGV